MMATRSVAALRPHHMRAMMANRAATPAAANDLLKKVSQLMRFAVERRWRPDDPTRNIAPYARSSPRRAWTAAELSTFAARWPASTTAGTALVLLLATRLRPKDIVRLKGADLIRVENAFGSVVAHGIQPDVFIVTTKRGAPFSAHGFVNFFSAAVKAANLPSDCVAGGLRKSRLTPGSVNLAMRTPARRQAAAIALPNTELLTHEPT